MKTLSVVFFSISILILGIFLNKDANAACTLCDPVNYTEKSIFYNGAECALEIKIRFAECNCPGANCSRDVEIYEVNEMNGGDCDDYTQDEIMEIAIRYTLWESVDFFNIASPSSGWDVNLRMEKCWEKSLSKYTPCTDDNCCEGVYELVKSDDSVYISDETVSGTDICSGPTYQDCEFVCDIMELPEDESLIKPSLPPLCGGDCPEVEWKVDPLNYASFSYTHSSTSCDFIVYYANRVCSSEVQVQPYRVEFDGTCDYCIDDDSNDDCSCDDGELLCGDKYELYNAAIKKVLRHWADNYGDGNQIDITLKTPDCWKSFISSSCESIYAPCGIEDCCERTYTVELVNNNYQVTDQTSTSGNGGSCDPCANYFPNCNSHCNYYSLYVEEDVNLKISSGESIDKINDMQEETYVQPNPSENQIDIIFISDSDFNGKVELKIFDAMGNSVMEFSEEKNSAELVWNIDSSELTSGLYIYKIISNGKVTAENKFIIQK